MTTGDGDFVPSDIMVFSAGIGRTIEMACRDHFQPEYLEKMNRLRVSEAFIATKFILDRKVTTARASCLPHLPTIPPHATFDYLEDGSIPDDLFLFVTVPGRWDPSLVSPDKDLLILGVAGVPAPDSLDRLGQCDLLLDKAEDITRGIFPKIDTGVVGRQRIHNAHISVLTGRDTGEYIGLAQETARSGNLKPTPSMPLEGLNMVGSDAGGRGIGTECVAESAPYVYNLLKYVTAGRRHVLRNRSPYPATTSRAYFLKEGRDIIIVM